MNVGHLVITEHSSSLKGLCLLNISWQQRISLR